jgi:hypothetical protein
MSRIRKPFCADCGSAQCHVVSVEGGGNVWLCGSCEMLRADPAAPKRKVPEGLPINWRKPRGRKPQGESLF